MSKNDIISDNATDDFEESLIEENDDIDLDDAFNE